MISNDFIQITPNSTTVYLLGKPFTYNPKISQRELNEQLRRAFSDIIWFTYRRNFPILKPQNPLKNFISDTGWGCMIRAGQMMWAEVLRRLWDLKMSKDLIELIRLFLDSELKLEKAPFSIQQISQKAAKNFNVLPGEWYKATTIIMSLEECYDEYLKFCNKNEKVAFSVFPDGCIFVDKILEKVTKPKKCEFCQAAHLKRKLKNHKNSEENNEKKRKFQPGLCKECLKFERNLFLMVCLRLGSGKPNPEYFPMMKYLMSSPYSVGVLGGRPRRALYFVGFQNDLLIIQDPHYVQA